MAQSQVHVEVLLPWFIASFFLVVHPTNPFIWIITTIVESSITFQTVLETFCMFTLSSLYSVSGTIFCNPTNISALPPTPGFPGSSAGKEPACNEGGPALIPGSGRSTGEVIGYPLQYSWASLVVQTIKNLPAIRETWVQSWVGKIPWRGNDYPLQYSGLENSMDYIVHGVAKSWTWLREEPLSFNSIWCLKVKWKLLSCVHDAWSKFKIQAFKWMYSLLLWGFFEKTEISDMWEIQPCPCLH